ncbi:MAG: cupin domain-containing protein [bacterium]
MEAAKSPAEINPFPSEILSLPLVEIPIDGVTGYCLHNSERQLVFFVMEEGVSFPDHTHCTQSGKVICGEMTMEIDGQTELYGPGDTYRVPEGTKHRTHFSMRTYLIDMSNAPDRYTVCV